MVGRGSEKPLRYSVSHSKARLRLVFECASILCLVPIIYTQTASIVLTITLRTALINVHPNRCNHIKSASPPRSRVMNITHPTSHDIAVSASLYGAEIGRSCPPYL